MLAVAGSALRSDKRECLMDIFPARGMDIDFGKLPVKPIVIIDYRVTYSVAYWVSNAAARVGGQNHESGNRKRSPVTA
ncbi:hypothetical protein JCM12107_12080 [Corynebacterium simulans]